MYAQIQNGIIYHERGDSLKCPIEIFNGTKLNPVKYEVQENDELYFAVLEPNASFENSLIRKKYDFNSEKDENGNILLNITPEDTEYLMTGLYYYTVKMRRGLEVHTIIPLTQFYIIGTNPPKKDCDC